MFCQITKMFHAVISKLTFFNINISESTWIGWVTPSVIIFKGKVKKKSLIKLGSIILTNICFFHSGGIVNVMPFLFSEISHVKTQVILL